MNCSLNSLLQFTSIHLNIGYEKLNSFKWTKKEFKEGKSKPQALHKGMMYYRFYFV